MCVCVCVCTHMHVCVCVCTHFTVPSDINLYLEHCQTSLKAYFCSSSQPVTLHCNNVGCPCVSKWIKLLHAYDYMVQMEEALTSLSATSLTYHHAQACGEGTPMLYNTVPCLHHALGLSCNTWQLTAELAKLMLCYLCILSVNIDIFLLPPPYGLLTGDNAARKTNQQLTCARHSSISCYHSLQFRL